VRLTRFVYRDGDAHAVYYACFTPGHRERRLSGLVGLGEWDEESTTAERAAFPFEIWMDRDNFQVGLTNAADTPYGQVALFGRILDRAEALKHPWLQNVFHITDHMVSDDKVIVEYFAA
jgi:hypothetical protein